MSKIAIELLHAIGFLKADNSVADITNIPQNELSGRLAYYHDKRIELADRELETLAKAKLKNAALLSSISAANAVIPLCPKLLMQEAIITGDPLFDFSAPHHEFSKVQNQALGLEDDGIDVRRLQNKLLYFHGLAAFMESGFLHALPLSILHRPPSEVPIYAPENLYRELVPDKAVDLIRSSAIISPLRKVEGKGVIIDDQNRDQRTRQICIEFRDDEPRTAGVMYFFRNLKILGKNPDGSYLTSQELWNDEPLDQAQYDIWIEQSINKTVGNRLESIAREMRLADFISVPYLTESTFEANLLSKAMKSSLHNTDNAINFLEANLDRLRLSSPIDTFRMRTENELLLSNFRDSLADIAQRLKGLAGEEFTAQARLLFKSDIQPQIEEVKTAARKIVESTAKGAIQTGVGVALAIMSGGAFPLCAALPLFAGGAAAEAIPTVADYLRLRQQPQYLWYKLSQS